VRGHDVDRAPDGVDDPNAAGGGLNES